MANWTYSDEEVRRYFEDRGARRTAPGGDGDGRAPGGGDPRGPERLPRRGFGWLRRFRDRLDARFDDPRKAQAAYVLAVLGGVVGGGVLLLVLVALALAFTLPPLSSIERPVLARATTAYTADGQELARYYLAENREWVPYDSISTDVVRALVATEDKRFYDHWGVDVFRTVSSVARSLAGDRQGGSTITQQLARNLYKSIGREVSVTRKIKEWMTAVQIERRYTKREILEMYLNTVSFGGETFGIQAAAETYFSKDAADLDVLEAATLVGMQVAVTAYNPVRNPGRSQQRRNVVLAQMMRGGVLAPADFDRLKNEPLVTRPRSADIVESRAPYFAMYVQNWLKEWGRRAGHDIYAEGLTVHTTLDSRMQTQAQAAVDSEMVRLQTVVDYEWSRQNGYSLGTDVAPYVRAAKTGGYEPFAYLWESQPAFVEEYVKKSSAYRTLREGGAGEADALRRLRADRGFQDSLKARITRLEAGLVALDPHTGHVKVWVGGRDLKTDWYDHVANAKRQPGSTFKPFVYTAAIDNGYGPDGSVGGGPFTWVGTGSCAGQRWSPANMGGGGNKSLRAALATSDNYVTARLVTLVNPRNVALYAQRMGITTDLIPAGVRAECYMSLALGTSDVTLYELTSAYATLANGGLYTPPTVVTRIEDRLGNVLYEAQPTPREALAEETAFTVVDMMRGAVEYGTAIRLRPMFGLAGYDFAAKTGTTQGNADGWFMIMHPDLVVGSWVGFNDRRIAFRSVFWGQGAHNAMYLTGDFLRRLKGVEAVALDPLVRFPDVEFTAALESVPVTDVPEAQRPVRPPPREEAPAEQGRVEW